MSDPEHGALVPVHLLQLPVQLAARTQQHFEELQREFALMSLGRHDAPVRLLALVDALTARYAGVSDAATQRLEAAIDRGDEVLPDHVLELPLDATEATQALADMMDEVDDFCRSGTHLLTLATPDECVRYRRWYLGQVLDQLRGGAATPWPAFPALRPV